MLRSSPPKVFFVSLETWWLWWLCTSVFRDVSSILVCSPDQSDKVRFQLSLSPALVSYISCQVPLIMTLNSNLSCDSILGTYLAHTMDSWSWSWSLSCIEPFKICCLFWPVESNTAVSSTSLCTVSLFPKVILMTWGRPLNSLCHTGIPSSSFCLLQKKGNTLHRR